MDSVYIGLTSSNHVTFVVNVTAFGPGLPLTRSAGTGAVRDQLRAALNQPTRLVKFT